MALATSAPLGYVQQSLTVAANLSTIPAGATYVVIVPETNGLRYRDDGTDPTAAIGIPVSAGQTLTYDGSLSKLRIVSQTGTSTVNIAYYAARHP